jgi:hypothetical protein
VAVFGRDLNFYINDQFVYSITLEEDDKLGGTVGLMLSTGEGEGAVAQYDNMLVTIPDPEIFPVPSPTLPPDYR